MATNECITLPENVNLISCNGSVYFKNEFFVDIKVIYCSIRNCCC